MKYILHGPPTALQRPRFCKGRVVDFQSHDKLLDGIQIKKQHGRNPFYDGPLLADITFFMPFPASATERKRDRLRETFHAQRCDLDNLIKYILDVCNGILYKDDATIAQIFAKKIWADTGKTELIITELEKSEADQENPSI